MSPGGLLNEGAQQGTETDIATVLSEIRSKAQMTPEHLAKLLGVSLVSVSRWERGASTPSPAQIERIKDVHRRVHASGAPQAAFVSDEKADAFSSRGIRQRLTSLPLFQHLLPNVVLSPIAFPPILSRLMNGRGFLGGGPESLARMLEEHGIAATTREQPLAAVMSAGKNTYAYDAHTYHTKVPPQGIAELLRHYLPTGGLVLDPFAGSGMTGVACRAIGYDCILNELSPAACFIANRFVSFVDPTLFDAGVKAVLDELRDLRATLYTTTCRECGKSTELLYTVWSYRVLCYSCGHEFLLWDYCRRYGRRVREHKILSEFPCPACRRLLVKSRLRRTQAEPVLVGYQCCGSRQQEVTHPPDDRDLERMRVLEQAPLLAPGFYPQHRLPDGVNLRQPKNHEIDSVARFYTPRNLAALSHLWQAIHRIEDSELAAHLAFAFTSLYQRVTRLSEFRFWGGSGNTARFNVPFIFNEANVFVTFARKARAIQDHLEATAAQYRGHAVVVRNSATSLDYLPDNSIDLIFTDPPFGANINYSEMNYLWEAWLGEFTDPHDEAIINKVQHKGVREYRRLMTESLRECYRVLRPGHWMLLVFMNSSREVWDALKAAITDAGFEIRQANSFDKQHGTFKQFVSQNTAGYDLVLHCWKSTEPFRATRPRNAEPALESILAFLSRADIAKRTTVYLHVNREEEVDYRSLYSEWISQSILQGTQVIDFDQFCSIVKRWSDRATSS
ncbi:MAG: helix-turn-helix domain-containing protein [Chloroflexi bacterium]|nr:helix-turn-helix domain-containing protein [Chloroflexota bacterium]